MARERTEISLIVRDSKRAGGNYGEIVKAGIPHRLLAEQIVGDDRMMRILAVGDGIKR